MSLVSYNKSMFKKLKLIGLIAIICLFVSGLTVNQVNAAGPLEGSMDQQTNIDNCVEKRLGEGSYSEEEKNAAIDACTVDTKCNVGIIGWLVCPIFEIIGNVSDSSFGFLQEFFYINPSNLSQDSNRESWSQVRNLANAGLVIFFLIVIFSQLTGYGLNNYSIKKALPKIIMATILINLSYYLSLFLIDLSNIIGSSVASLFKTFENNLFADQSSTIGTAAGAGAATAIVAAIFGIGVSATQTQLMTTVISMLFAFIITVLITLLFLLAREAIAIVLVIMSPIAFLALIFPNAENIYKTWKKGMTVIIMMFPIMGMLFGASSLVSAILANSSNSIINQTLALIMSALPMVFAPNLIKSSIASMPLVGSKISTALGKLQTGTNQRFNNSGYMQMRRKYDQHRADQLLSGQYNGRNIFRRGTSSINRFINQHTAVGRARLDEINQRSASQIDSLSSRFSESDSNAIQAAIARGDTSINTTGLSAGARQAIAAAGLTGRDLSQLSMAGALNSAKRGNLDDRSYDQAVMFANTHGGINQSAMDDLSEKMRVASAAKGRFDTSAYIGGLQKNNQLNASMATRNANRLNYVTDGMSRLSSDDLAKMNYHTLDAGSTGQQAFTNLYRQNSHFANTVNTAQANAEMSARTSQAIQGAK